MRILVLLVGAAIVFGLVYLNSTHEDGLRGVWDDVTSQDVPAVEIEYQPIAP